MNPERLFAYYEKIADAPDAIPRLRRFILDLAVRGKLVPQDPNDEPASELLKRIAAEKARLVKTRNAKPRELVLDATREMNPSRLRPGWAMAYVANITICLDHRREPINETERRQRIGGKSLANLYPYYGATQQQGWIDDYLFDEELVLLGEDGAPFLDPCRPKAYMIAGKTWVNNHAHVFKGLLISHRYIVSALNVFDYSGKVVGATRAKLNQSQALNIPIALPPLAEQHRIVAKLDELMALCDRLEAARKTREATRNELTAASLVRLNAPDPETFCDDARFVLDALPALTARADQIKQLRQTILNLAVRGKLVSQDPNDEPASELLKRIAAEKARLVRDGVIKKQKPPLPGSEHELVEELPPTWSRSTLGELSMKIHYGYTASANYNLKDVRFLRITDIQDNRVVWSTVPGCAIGCDVLPDYTLRKGDILIARTGGTIGKTFLVAGVPVVSVFASYLIRVQPEPPLYDRYIKTFCESDVYWRQLRDGSRGGAQPNVNGRTLGRMFVPLPPLAEQHRIVAKVDELMALCDRLEASLVAADETRHRLLEALLAEALAPNEVCELEAAGRAGDRVLVTPDLTVSL